MAHLCPLVRPGGISVQRARLLQKISVYLFRADARLITSAGHFRKRHSVNIMWFEVKLDGCRSLAKCTVRFDRRSRADVFPNCFVTPDCTSFEQIIHYGSRKQRQALYNSYGALWCCWWAAFISFRLQIVRVTHFSSRYFSEPAFVSIRKQQAPHPGARTPFDCCSLSFQPFEHPVCVRNPDGTGNVFDLVNILPWLKCVYVSLLSPMLPHHILKTA